MEIKLGNTSDIDGWMNLVEKVKDDFPGLETTQALNEHRNTVLAFMGKESAICAKTDNKIVGTLLFSKEDHILCFLAVDIAYRRQHIAEKWYPICLHRWIPGRISRLPPIGRAYRRESPQGHSTSESVLLPES